MKFWPACLLIVVAVSLTANPVSAKDDSNKLKERVAQLEEKVALLEEKLQYLSVVEEAINGLAGPHVIIEGANLHVQNGSGDTWMENGLGNLIVGYNEGQYANLQNRDGSHNLVLGMHNEYTRHGGLVAGDFNKIFGRGASITGGRSNTANGQYSVISGGQDNYTYGEAFWATISDGGSNKAQGRGSTVSGGFNNWAMGDYSTVSGGQDIIGTGHWEHYP